MLLSCPAPGLWQRLRRLNVSASQAFERLVIRLSVKAFSDDHGHVALGAVWPHKSRQHFSLLALGGSITLSITDNCLGPRGDGTNVSQPLDSCI
jgi:hypothetical protein